MRFTLTTTGTVYTDDRKRQLEALGFRLKPYVIDHLTRPPGAVQPGLWTLVEPAIAIELATLEDLLQLEERAGYPLIFMAGAIEIYDDYH